MKMNRPQNTREKVVLKPFKTLSPEERVIVPPEMERLWSTKITIHTRMSTSSLIKMGDQRSTRLYAIKNSWIIESDKEIF
jgi:hypothetical protein